MCKTMRINLFDLNKTTLFWIVLFLLGSYFYSAKVSAQTAITITGTSPNTFNITVPEGVSTRSVRLAGDLSDVVVYVQRTSDPAAERTLTIPSSNNTLIGGGGLSVATLDAVEEIADKVFHLKFALDSPAPAGDVWLIRVSKPSADTRTIYWMEGELNDAFGATYVSDVFAAPSPMEFDSVIVGDTKTLTITVHNRFAQDMTLAAALEYGDRGFSISSSVGSPVTGVSSTDIDISFNPVDESAKTDTLHLTTNDPDTPVLDVILNGTGTTRRIILALDYSGSMSCAYDEPWPCSDALESSRIAQARNALEPFLDDLEIGVSPGTIGAVRVGAVRFGGGPPAVEVEYGLNPINGSHINAMKGALGIPYSGGTGPSTGGTGTRISDGLNQCLTLFGDSNDGVILLMSDGYAEPSGQDPRDTGVLTSIVNKGIPVFSVAFGENGAFVDHELMEDIQEQTNGEFVVFGAGSGESIPADLASVYTQVLD
ncbi:VWA domain-containing protein, partial [Desulfobacter postgatei]|uniref:VWA domain-containing protein n=1 Tax=Desulfobacter postgatei TaxID=2293 RepID=UPI002A35E8F2